MSNTINYFMWAYQSHFWGVQRGFVRDVFKRLGLTFDPEVFLVGALIEERNDRHAFCVEPEEGNWLNPEILSDCLSDVDRLVNEYPESTMMISNSHSSERHQAQLYRRAISDAMRQRIVASPSRTESFEYFFSDLVLIDSFLVMMVVGIPGNVRESYPKLTSHEYKIHESRIVPIPTCLIDAVIDELMQNAMDVLGREQREQFFNSRGADDLLRDAARNLTRSLALRCDTFFNTFGGESNLFDNICRIATTAYETSRASGAIVLAKQDHPKLLNRLRFSKPLTMDGFRGVRKLLELTRSGLYSLHTNSNHVWGLVDRTPMADIIESEDVFEILFTGLQRWECRHQGRVLMQVENRIPSLPGQQVDQKQLRANLMRFFPTIGKDVVDSYIKLVETCAGQQHGALLVISIHAESESKRLSNQSTPVVPIPIDEHLMDAVSSIDGAVLLDIEGNCWAIGVILDGLACPEGNPARGARYNSAIRYVSTRWRECLVFIVSEDGGMDIVPQLQSQVSRKLIDAKIDLVREIAAKDRITRNIFDHICWLDDHRFYLLEDDCTLLNQIVPDIEKRWIEETGATIRIVRKGFEVNPRFDVGLYYSE